MNEKNYLDNLYCVQEAIEDDFAKYAEEIKKGAKLDKGRVEYGDALMHFAKNLRKELFAEEGMNEDEIEEFTGSRGGTQAYGRAIRTTPGMWDDGGDSYRGSSMRGGSYRGSMRGYSTRRDSKGRFTSNSGPGENWSGHEDMQDAISKIKRMADMTTNHDEREFMLNMIERLKMES